MEEPGARYAYLMANVRHRTAFKRAPVAPTAERLCALLLAIAKRSPCAHRVPCVASRLARGWSPLGFNQGPIRAHLGV